MSLSPHGCNYIFFTVKRPLFQWKRCNILELTLLNKISIIARSDLRKAINLLQNCNNSYDSKTNEELLYEFSGFILEDKFNKLFEYIFKKDMQIINLLVNWLFYC